MNTFSFREVAGSKPDARQNNAPWKTVSENAYVSCDTANGQIIFSSMADVFTIKPGIDAVLIKREADSDFVTYNNQSDESAIYNALKSIINFKKANSSSGATVSWDTITGKPLTDAEITRLKQMVAVDNT